MSLTRIGSIGINTGIAFAGVTTIVTLNTANDALSIGATVNVGSGITLGASGDGFFTGVVTATSYVGDGSALTGVAATDNVRTGILDVAGVGTFRNDVNIPDKIIHLGDTNTAIRFPAADTITAETGGSEALRIDSGGRLLLGTTTEGHAAADDLTIENTAADMGITLRSGTSNQGAIYFSDGTTGDAEYRGIINYNHANDALSVYTSATERIRITSDGDLSLRQSTQNEFRGLLANSTAINLTLGSTTSTETRMFMYGTGNGQPTAGNILLASGDGGKLYLRGADETVFETNGNNRRMTISSDGYVLIGTQTEGHGDADNLTIYDSANAGITIRSGTGNAGHIYFSDGVTGAAEYKGIIAYNQNSDYMSFWTNGDTEKMRIDSTGRMLMNTTSVGHGDADALTIASTGGYTGITLRSDTDQGGAIYFSDATSGTAQYDGFFYYNQNLRKMVFGTAQTNAMSIDSSGNIDAVIGNFVVATSGKGLDFAATGGPNNGSGTSELLDDYEEGTFTPAYAMSSGGHNITYATQQGNYTKIGDTVSIEIYITINGINANGTGSLYVTGLPFTKTGRYGGMNISYPHGLNNNEITHALVDVNSTNLYLYNFDGSSVTNATVAGSFTVNTQMMFNGTYLAA
jgi:hypothetical protein